MTALLLQFPRHLDNAPRAFWISKAQLSSSLIERRNDLIITAEAIRTGCILADSASADLLKRCVHLSNSLRHGNETMSEEAERENPVRKSEHDVFA